MMRNVIAAAVVVIGALVSQPVFAALESYTISGSYTDVNNSSLTGSFVASFTLDAASGTPFSDTFYDGSNWSFTSGTVTATGPDAFTLTAVTNGIAANQNISKSNGDKDQSFYWEDNSDDTFEFDINPASFSNYATLAVPVGTISVNGTYFNDFGSNEVFTFNSVTITAGLPVSTPEPASMLIIGAGLIGLTAARRKRSA
jgi:hypothetical protein